MNIPVLLQEKYSLLLEKKLEKPHRNKIVGQFITFACRQLEIEKPYPRVILNNDEEFGPKYKTFGMFHVEDNKIVVAAANRNLADILRTIAHELTHYKQKLDGRIHIDNADDSGKAGSEIENEANARAGIIMREFGHMFPQIYE